MPIPGRRNCWRSGKAGAARWMSPVSPTATIIVVEATDAFEAIDPAKVSRLDKVFPELRTKTAIPHIYSAQVILYNVNQVKTPPTSWADLWDPKWRGRVGLADILYPNNTIMAALAGGGSMSNYDPGEKKLMELRSLDAKIYPSNEALAAALKSEEVWLTSMWLARGFMWKKAGIPLSHVVPKEGAVSIVFEASVPRNARNKDGGFAYLDAMLDPKAQAAFADKMGYVPTVSDAVLPEDIAKAGQPERSRPRQAHEARLQISSPSVRSGPSISGTRSSRAKPWPCWSCPPACWCSDC